ncbi:hypothetical protein JKP88DRAFT_330592, partial [Tribonema minus]
VGTWHRCQRVAFQAGTLSAERLQQLQSANFDLTVRPTISWHDSFAAWVAEHGSGSKLSKRVATWVKTQHTAYQNRFMSKERIAMLQEAGFVFKRRTC